jgi:hypothetical protein
MLDFDREFWTGLLITVIIWGLAALFYYYIPHPTL